ncbi:MAG: hypothetical protein GF421_11920 [Candidatus Aminicenantes bacterium]|nr:hypothetical protein [Candidatus Aminicenantes bacterium]
MNMDRLDSWKEISEYLKRDVRTCIRWKNLYSLPVHKIDEKSSYSRVFAYKSEIDQWLKEKSNHKVKDSILTNKWTYVVLVAVLIPLITVYIYFRSNQQPFESSPDLSTLAVLPIQNTEPSQKINFICEGITNEIINRLILLNDLKVIPLDPQIQQSGMTHRPASDLQTLGAEYLLKGKTIHQKKGVRLSLKLIQVSTNSKIWEKQFDHPEKDITHIIESTYLKITELLNDSNNEPPFLGSYMDHNSFIEYLKGEYILNNMKSGNTDPWKLYIKGKYLTGKCSPESNEVAINFFNKAIDLDQNFALPYIGLAQCYSNYVNFAWDTEKEWMEKAESLVNKAKSLSYEGPEFFSTAIEINLIQLVGFGENNSQTIDLLAEEGIKEYKNDPQLNSIVGYWNFLKFGKTGNNEFFKKALDFKERSFLLSPSSLNNMVYAELLMLNQEFAKSLDVCKNTERNNPSSFTKFRLGEVYYYQGDLNKSRFIFNQFENADIKLKIDSLFFLAMISSQLGETKKTKQTINRIELLSPDNTTNEDDLKMASIYFGLNEKELGYKHLIKHFKELMSEYNHFIDFKYIQIDQNFDAVRHEDNFINILKGFHNDKQQKH